MKVKAMKKVAAILLSIGALLLCTCALADEVKVEIGSPAPVFNVAKWVKGQPIKAFQPGKVYVVEFWATWCGPCKKCVPHLSELAKKYDGKVTFVGVAVWEQQGGDGDYAERVTQFVSDMGDKMVYNVGLDDSNGSVAKAWMDASGTDGIPTVFVIGKDQRIWWIGHPMDPNIEKAIELADSGKFDTKSAKAINDIRWAAHEAALKEKAVFNKALDCENKGDAAGEVKELDKVFANHPEYEEHYSLLKYRALKKINPAMAYAYARRLADGVYKEDAEAVSKLALMVVQDNRTSKTPDFDTALFLARRAVEMSDSAQPLALQTLAMAYSQKGDFAKAVQYQKQAIVLLDQSPDTPDDTKRLAANQLRDYVNKLGK